MYVPLLHYLAELPATLAADAATVTLPGLADRLGEGHTFLKLSMGRDFEIVAASVEAGALVLERGQEGTVARKWPKGTPVQWLWTPLAICQMIACGGCGAEFPLAQPVKPCDDPGCCKPVGSAITGAVPVPKIGERWELSVGLTGSPDFEFGEGYLPGWMQAELVGDALMLFGTPREASGERVAAMEIRNACSAKTVVFRVPEIEPLPAEA